MIKFVLLKSRYETDKKRVSTSGHYNNRARRTYSRGVKMRKPQKKLMIKTKSKQPMTSLISQQSTLLNADDTTRV